MYTDAISNSHYPGILTSAAAADALTAARPKTMNSVLLKSQARGVLPQQKCACRQLAQVRQGLGLSRNGKRTRSSKHAQREVWAAAAEVQSEVEDTSAGDVDDLEDDSGGDESAAQASSEPESSSLEGLDYRLNFLWMDKNIAVAVDQVFAKDQRSPVTEYFFWPRKDAWEELRVSLEAKPWISVREKVMMLNRTTEVINFWQTEGKKPDINQATKAFPDCTFKGS